MTKNKKEEGMKNKNYLNDEIFERRYRKW